MLFHKQAQKRSENVNILKPVCMTEVSAWWTVHFQPKRDLDTMCQNTQMASEGF